MTSYDSRSLVKDKTYFKKPKNSRCVGLFITNSIGSFQKTTAVLSGSSDFHKMIVTTCKTSFEKSKSVLRLKLRSIKSYEFFEEVFFEVLNGHVPLKKKFLRANHTPYMTKSLRKTNLRLSELESKYLKNRTIENKAKYKKQNNICSKLYKKERKKFYSNLELNQITDNKRFSKKLLLSGKCI